MYRGCAKDYDLFRPSYPKPLIRKLVQESSGLGRLLDLGAGTGQLAKALAQDFEEVWAIDSDLEMIDEGSKGSPNNVHWKCCLVEELEEELGLFDSIVIGRSLAYFDLEGVFPKLKGFLEKGGSLFITGDQPSPHHEFPLWKEELEDYLNSYCLEQVQEPSIDPILLSRLLKETGMVEQGTYYFMEPLTWKVKELIGYLHSRPPFSREHLGERVKRFDIEVEALLSKYENLEELSLFYLAVYR